MPQGEVLPQVLVFQEFAQTPAELTAPLRAFVAGPCYHLFRYSEAAEKELVGLGAYDWFNDRSYAWPNRPAGGVVDQDWTRLFFDNALLKYFEDSIPGTYQIKPVQVPGSSPAVYYPNKIRCSTLIFKTGNGYTHSSVFKDRGVALGDVVNLRKGTDELRTTVVGFVAEKTTAIVGAAAQGVDNKDTQSLIPAPPVDQTSGEVNEVQGIADATGYDGREAGDLIETYVIKCVKPSTGGVASTAKLEVKSASGHDDMLSFSPSIFGMPTPIGTRGLAVTFDITGSSSSGMSDPIDFLQNQQWTVTAQQAFAKPTAVSSGVYDGPKDTVYIAEVIRGGPYAGPVRPMIQITTSTGVDSSGPQEISGTGAVSIGRYGVEISFGNEDAGLCKGDKYTIPVTAAKDAQIRTILLGDNMPAGMLGNNDLETELFIKKNVEIDRNREGFSPITNFQTAETQVTIENGIIAYDSSWTESGTLLALPVMEADMFVQYRALRADFQFTVQTMTDISLVVPVVGPVTPDNPLALALYLALLNSNGTAVKFMNTPSTLAGHSEVINRILDRKDVYGLVPLTFDPNIQDLYQGHVDGMSTPEKAGWRVAWFSTQGSSTKGIRTTDAEGDPFLCTVEDDPDTTGTQYTILKCSTGDFKNTTSPVRAGDIIRLNYVDDGFGNLSYEEYVVDEVVNGNTIRLATGPTAPITTPSKFEDWRNLSKDEIAAAIAMAAGVFGDRRVRNVWPDTVGWNGVDIDGYYICAALAGLRSGIVPQQGMTNLEVKGFDDLSRTTEFFNSTQLTTMAKAGTWIVTRADENSLNPGAVYTRQQLTTDTSSIENGEDSLVANPDSISYLFYNRLSHRIGTNNITPILIQQLKTEIFAIFEYLKTAGFNDRIGGQIIGGDVVRIAKHPLLKDRLQAVLSIELPYPLNNLELYLVFA